MVVSSWGLLGTLFQRGIIGLPVNTRWRGASLPHGLDAHIFISVSAIYL
jgi:hypothetical protein